MAVEIEVHIGLVGGQHVGGGECVDVVPGDELDPAELNAKYPPTPPATITTSMITAAVGVESPRRPAQRPERSPHSCRASIESTKSRVTPKLGS
ncbi:MAG TPA: hypothetical protein VMH78_05570 [Thermoplasmata archaeon]|nr:hypothetical protein [Thermoplasmata archaeon]